MTRKPESFIRRKRFFFNILSGNSRLNYKTDSSLFFLRTSLKVCNFRERKRNCNSFVFLLRGRPNARHPPSVAFYRKINRRFDFCRHIIEKKNDESKWLLLAWLTSIKRFKSPWNLLFLRCQLYYTMYYCVKIYLYYFIRIVLRFKYML